jgi:hypothetical protein
MSDINWGDVPTAISLLLAAIAIIEARRARRESSKYAKVAADAARRSADVDERMLALEEAATKPPEVAFQLERLSKSRFVLRNTGTEMATGVYVDGTKIKTHVRDLPAGASIPAGGSHEFMMMTSMGAPLPNDVWVSWDGAPAPKALGVPPSW